MMLLKSCWLLAYLDSPLYDTAWFYFSFVLGALSNRLLNVPVSHVLASEGGSVASSGIWWVALLFGLCASLATAKQVWSNWKRYSCSHRDAGFLPKFAFTFCTSFKYIRAWNRNCGTEPLLCYKQGDDISWVHSCGLSSVDCTVNFFLWNFI